MGGNASGKEAAEKKDMLSGGCEDKIEGGDGRRLDVASCVFSGMERNEGMLYLIYIKYI